MLPNTCQAIIFDLDGTLIDSAPAILQGFASVLEEAGIAPVVPLDSTLIGPPLRQTLMKLTSLPAGDELERLARGFQRIYDEEGYKATRVYAGIDELLARCAGLRVPLAIATNKRRTPTLKIIDYFGWNGYFQLVGTLDGMAVTPADKAALIAYLLAEMKFTAERTLYVGDKWEDGEAATVNGMPFVAVDWGYGEWTASSLPADWHLVRAPHEVPLSLERIDKHG